jgi:hypothetical protein
MNIEELEQLASECEIAHQLSGKAALTQNELASLKHSSSALADYCKPKVDASIKRATRQVNGELKLAHKSLLLKLCDIGGGLGYSPNHIPANIQLLIDHGYVDFNGRISSITKSGLAFADSLKGK